MDKKKILIVSRSFYPMNAPRSFRTTELAKEFARQGHKVTVLIPDVNNERVKFSETNKFQIADMGRLRWKDIQLQQKNPWRFISSMIKNFLSLYFYYPDIELVNRVKKSLIQESGYDILLTIASPHSVHWGAAFAWKKNHKIAKTWIADCGDPFYLSQNAAYKKPIYFKYLEKYFCKKADFITVPVEGAREGYFPEFHSKIHVIPQGFKFDDLPKCENINNEVVTFAYAGALVAHRRNPKMLIEHLLSKGYNFKFFIFTNTPYLVSSYAQLYPDKIILHSYIDRSELMHILSSMDFLLNFANVGNTQLPSKLIDYAFLKKPILSLNSQSIDTSLVDEFIEGNYTRQLKIENIDQYRIENIAERFIKLV